MGDFPHPRQLRQGIVVESATNIYFEPRRKLKSEFC